MKYLKLGNKIIGQNQPCFIIAEAGANHNHNLNQAKELIDVASDCGADAIKFQSIKFDELYLPSFPPSEKVKSLYPAIELPEEWYKELFSHAKKRNILLLSCPTYIKAVDLLLKFGVAGFKIASPQTKANLPLLSYAAKKQKPLIISTGYCNLTDIEQALRVCQKARNNQIVLLHCTAKYPILANQANLKVMGTLAKKFKTLVGYSDHTLGFNVSLGAVALGACVLEKHFTLSRKLKGPDHFYAQEPKELKEMIKQIREVEQSFGKGKKTVLSEEKKLYSYIQTRVAAKCDIKKGQVLKWEMLDFKRMPRGFLANEWEKLLNKKVKKDIKKGEPFFLKHI
ncbi:MAG: N-acetylneuraminate synthase family protein [Candidatus Pacebacteria bacterium]|nr:N-acetylneuraminate synthase family protein [Candidatus Paceibacterota bacterium]